MKKTLSALILSSFLLSGCGNSSDEVIKVTSPKTPVKNGKKLSLQDGLELLQAGKTDEAISFFVDYKDFFVNDFHYFNYLGDAYVKKSNFSRATLAYEKSLELNQNQPALLIKIANISEKLNNTQKALEYYVKYVFESGDDSQNNSIREKLNKNTVVTKGTGIVNNFFLTSKNSPEIAFGETTPKILAKINLSSPQKSDTLEVKWMYTTSTGEFMPVNSAKIPEISSNKITSSIKAPSQGWPKGKYAMKIFVNGEENSSCGFYIF